MAGDLIRLSGFRELDAALADLPKAIERRILREVAADALKPFVEMAQSLAPVHEGHLRDSIVIGTKLTRGARRDARKDPVEGVRVFAGTADPNGVPREFGSARSRAEPFMRPAWDATGQQMLDRVQRTLADKIERRAARGAKKRN